MKETFNLGGFTFEISKADRSRSNTQYLHIYEGTRQLTSYGCKLRNGRFENLILIEDAPVIEVALLVSKYTSISKVKVNPRGHVNHYSGTVGSWVIWDRNEKCS